MKTLHITAPEKATTSTIHITSGAIKQLARLIKADNYSCVFVVSDDGVAPHYLSDVLAVLPGAASLVLPSGENNKNIATVQRIWQALAAAGCDRQSLLVNLGGGVLCDVGGFAAATYMRGIEYVNIPTTLLAQVDASVGGKNGCNEAGVKNLVGTFTQPRHVVIDPQVLATLPQRQLIAGFGEIIKHGLIASSAHVQQATAKRPAEFSAKELAEIISESCTIKRDIVAQDVTEQGARKLVNFGHTVGHAIEALSLQTATPLLHGEAVSIGMMAETYIACEQGLLSQTDAGKVKTLLQYAGLPIAAELPISELMAKMKQDKKNVAGEINFTLLTGIGQAVINQTVSEAVVIKALERIGATA